MDARTGKTLRSQRANRQPDAGFRVFASSRDREWRAAWNSRKPEIIVAKWDQLEPVHRIAYRGGTRGLAIGKAGQWVAAIDHTHPLGFRVWKAPEFDSAMDWKTSEKKPISCLAGSPDGKTLYAGCADGSIQAWSMERGQEEARFSKLPTSSIFSLVCSPNGKFLAASTRERAMIYETATGQVVQNIEWERPVSGMTLAFSSGNKVLAVASWVHDIELWDVKTGQALHRRSPVIERVFATKDPGLFGSIHQSQVLYWSRETGEIVKSFSMVYRPKDGSVVYGNHVLHGTEQLILAGPNDEIYYRDLADGEAFEPFGQLPLGLSRRQTCSAEGQVARLLGPGAIRLYQIDPQNSHHPPTSHIDLKGSTSRCMEFAFFDNGRIFVAAFADRSIFVWEAGTGKLLQQLELDAVPKQFVLNSTGDRLAAVHESSLAIWDLKVGKPCCQIPDIETSKLAAAFGYKGRFLAFTRPGEPIHIWNLESGKEVFALPAPDSPVKSLAWSRDDKQLAVGLEDKSIRLFDLQTKKETAKLQKHQGAVTCLLFHPDGRRLISASESASDKPEVGVWDVANGKPVRIVGGYWDQIAQLVLSADGRHVIVNSLGNLGYRAPAPFRFALDPFRHVGRISTILTSASARDFAYSQESKFLALAYESGIRCLDRKTGREFPFVVEEKVAHIEWAPGGRVLMIAGTDLVGWDVQQQQEVYRIPQSQLNGQITSMAKSPDGKTIATGISNRAVCLWDPQTGRLIRDIRLPGQSQTVSLQFSPDGWLLFVLAQDVYFIIETESGLIWREKPFELGTELSFAQMGRRTLLSAESQGTARLWSWAPNVENQGPKSPEKLWDLLSKPDGLTVYRSMFALAELKDDTVAFLAKNRQANERPSASPKKIAALIEDLEAASPVVQRKASATLRDLGEAAHPQLKAALENEELSRQTQTRIRLLLAARSDKPEPRLSKLRAIQLLEWIGTPKAEKLLREYTKSAEKIGTKAQAALDRLSKSKQ